MVTCDRYAYIAGCAHVVMSHCRVNRVALYSSGSGLTLNQCDLKGLGATSVPVSYGIYSSNGLLVVGGHVMTMDTRIGGGDGNPGLAGSAAIGLVAGSLTVAGSVNSVFTAGLQGAGAPMPALEVSGSTVLFDPGAVLLPNFGAAAVSSFGNPSTVTTGRPIGLEANNASIGGPITLYVRSDVNEVFGIFASRAAGQPALSPFGTVWLDPLTFFDVAFGVQTLLQMATVSASVPNVPALFGATFELVAVGGGGAHPVRLSNHEFVMLR